MLPPPDGFAKKMLEGFRTQRSNRVPVLHGVVAVSVKSRESTETSLILTVLRETVAFSM